MEEEKIVDLREFLGERVVEMVESQRNYEPGSREWDSLQKSIDANTEQFRRMGVDADNWQTNENTRLIREKELSEKKEDNKKRILLECAKVAINTILIGISYGISWKMMKASYKIQDEAIINHPESVNRSRTFWENSRRERIK